MSYLHRTFIARLLISFLPCIAMAALCLREAHINKKLLVKFYDKRDANEVARNAVAKQLRDIPPRAMAYIPTHREAEQENQLDRQMTLLRRENDAILLARPTFERQGVYTNGFWLACLLPLLWILGGIWTRHRQEFHEVRGISSLAAATATLCIVAGILTFTWWGEWLPLSFSFRMEWGGYIVAAAGTLAIAQVWKLASRQAINRNILLDLCPACGYSLTANESGICPECGTPVLKEN